MTELVIGKTYTATKDLLVFTWEGDDFTLRKDDSVVLLTNSKPRKFRVTSGIYKDYEIYMAKGFKLSDLKAV